MWASGFAKSHSKSWVSNEQLQNFHEPLGLNDLSVSRVQTLSSTDFPIFPRRCFPNGELLGNISAVGLRSFARPPSGNTEMVCQRRRTNEVVQFDSVWWWWWEVEYLGG